MSYMIVLVLCAPNHVLDQYPYWILCTTYSKRVSHNVNKVLLWYILNVFSNWPNKCYKRAWSDSVQWCIAVMHWTVLTGLRRQTCPAASSTVSASVTGCSTHPPHLHSWNESCNNVIHSGALASKLCTCVSKWSTQGFSAADKSYKQIYCLPAGISPHGPDPDT